MPMALLGFRPSEAFPSGDRAALQPTLYRRAVGSNGAQGFNPARPRPAARCSSPRKSVVRRGGITATGTRSSPGFHPLQGSSSGAMTTASGRLLPRAFSGGATRVVLPSCPSKFRSPPDQAFSEERADPPEVLAPRASPSLRRRRRSAPERARFRDRKSTRLNSSHT